MPNVECRVPNEVIPTHSALGIRHSAFISRLILHPSAFILSVTLLAAFLRFSSLPRPPIWGDEAKTFMRSCGSFQQLVDTLATSDFAPLHYLLYWAIAQLTPLTPAVMRLPPAIAG